MNDSVQQQNGGMLEDCVFPFRYEDVLYDQCTQANYDKPWCATSTDEDENFVEGYWKNCSSASTISTAISATDSIEASSIDRSNAETSTISSSSDVTATDTAITQKISGTSTASASTAPHSVDGNKNPSIEATTKASSSFTSLTSTDTAEIPTEASSQTLPVSTITNSPIAEGIIILKTSSGMNPYLLFLPWAEVKERVEQMDKMFNPTKKAQFQEDLKQYKDDIR